MYITAADTKACTSNLLVGGFKTLYDSSYFFRHTKYRQGSMNI